MRTPKLVILLLLCVMSTSNAQENINELLAAGVADTQRYAEHYIAPATEGFVYGISNGWFNTAKSHRRFGFEISIIGNTSFIKDEKKKVSIWWLQILKTSVFKTTVRVKLSLLYLVPHLRETVILTYDDPIFGNQEVSLALPGGIGSSESSFVPTAFLQASFSPLKGTQIKARIVPKMAYQDAELNAYGFGIQQNLISWLPANKVLPVAISAVIAYTHLGGVYDFTSSNIVAGENQRMTLDVNSMLYQLVVGTKLKVINFYGSIGLIQGKNDY